MKHFLMAFSLIIFSNCVIFAQDFADEINKDKSISFTQKNAKIDKIEIDIIKDEKIEPFKPVIEKYTPKKKGNFPSRQNSGNEYNKNEFFVGYSYQNIDRGNRQHLNGFNVSYVRNVTKHIGIKGDFSGAYKNDSFSVTGSSPLNNPFTLSGETKNQQYNFLGGVQFKDNSSQKKLKPFAHLLVGATNTRFSTNSSCSGDCAGIIRRASFNSTHFSGAFGGGLDVKITDKIDFRAIQFDYNPIFPGGGVVNNFRIGVGFVFK